MINGSRIAPRVPDPQADWVPPQGDAPWIASIGHSDHDPDTFFALLAWHKVVAIVDVRKFPRSHVVQFNKPELAAETKRRGLAYHHLEGLGGKRDIAYPEHMESGIWSRAYGRLREIALSARHAGGLAVFMCVERDPARCHRRFVAERLERDGWRVLHILPDTAQTRLF